MRLTVILYFLGAVFVISSGTLYSQSIATYESSLKPLEARNNVEEILNQMDREGFYYKKKTMGFSYLISNRFLSPYSYRIYIGTISSKIPTTIIRLEGNRGDMQMLTAMMRQDLIIRTNKEIPENYSPENLLEKSHLAAQGLNIIGPGIRLNRNNYVSLDRITSFFDR